MANKKKLIKKKKNACQEVEWGGITHHSYRPLAHAKRSEHHHPYQQQQEKGQQSELEQSRHTQQETRIEDQLARLHSLRKTEHYIHSTHQQPVYQQCFIK